RVWSSDVCSSDLKTDRKTTMKGIPRISSTVLAIAAACLLTACSGGDSSSSSDDSSNRSSQTPVVDDAPADTGSDSEDLSLMDETSPEGMEELEDLVGGDMYY